MKKIKSLSCLSIILMAIVFLHSCDNFEGEQEIPAYVKFEGFNLIKNPSIEIDKFQSEDISDVWVYVDNICIGAYPIKTNPISGKKEITFPVLKEGKHVINLRPGVKLNGIAMTRAEYPFYNHNYDTCFLEQGKEINIGTKNIMYKDDCIFSFYEDFEGDSKYFKFSSPDSVHKIKQISHNDTVKYGTYCGGIYMKKGQNYFNLMSDELTVSRKNALILELDYWCNIPFSIGMNARMSSASKEQNISIMTINPNQNKGWQKIYIILGKVWGEFNYPNNLKFYISPLNNTLDNGWVYIDNVKVLNR